MSDNPILIRKPEIVLLEALDRIIRVATDREHESELSEYGIRMEYIKLVAKQAIDTVAKQKD